jgi:uncharacterized membrane protein SirB2
MSLGDMLYEMTDWLRTTPVVDLSIWISNLPLSLSLGTHFWAIPIIQTIHILSIAAAFGSVLMINLRVLGLVGKTSTMTQTIGRYVPWIWWALLLLVCSGIGMIIAEPIRELVNPIFWIKMVILIVLILVSLAFQAGVRRNMAHWEVTHDGRIAVRVGAAGLILLWCAVMVCGRWIAYAPV